MKRRYLLALLLSIPALASCEPEKTMPADAKLPAAAPKVPEGSEVITLGAGCFWCIEAAFKQLDRSLDEASLMLRASTSQTLFKVVLPLLKPALVAALVYSFVRAMTTVSAVIFLVTAENELATTYIIGRVGNGDYGIALAYCTVLMILMSLAIALVQFVVGERKLGRRKAGVPMVAAPVVH